MKSFSVEEHCVNGNYMAGVSAGGGRWKEVQKMSLQQKGKGRMLLLFTYLIAEVLLSRRLIFLFLCACR